MVPLLTYAVFYSASGGTTINVQATSKDEAEEVFRNLDLKKVVDEVDFRGGINIHSIEETDEDADECEEPRKDNATGVTPPVVTKYRVMFGLDIEANSEVEAEEKALEEIATCDTSDCFDYFDIECPDEEGRNHA